MLIRRAVDFSWDSGRAEGWGRDIGASGMFVETGQHLAAGADVQVTVHFRHAPQVSMAAQVCRSTPRGLALRFSNVGTAASCAISRVLARI